MRNTRYFELAVLSLVCASSAFFSACRNESHSPQHESPEEAPFARGPHRGRMLSCEPFSLEVSIFETGTPPHFRVYGTKGKAPIAPGDLSVSVVLQRLVRPPEAISFSPVGDFLESNEEIVEPHSFDVKVRAQYDGAPCEWSYSTYEGRTQIPQDVAQRSGIVAERAEPHVIRSYVRARGKILPSEHRIAHVIPRFAGVVREGRKHVGDPVEKGEVVAVIESNQSLQPFDVRAQISGTVINGHVIIGEFVPDSEWIYVIADLSVIWADLFVPLRDTKKLSVGQDVRISSVNSVSVSEGRVTYLAPYADERSQSRLVRVELPNPNSEFLPGEHVTGDISVEAAAVPVAIRRSAVQRFNGSSAVFVKSGDTYEAQPIETGREDGDWVEVVAGLEPNAEYVTENSFLVKADILKSGATHDH